MSATTHSTTSNGSASLWRRFAGMLYDLLPLLGLWIAGSIVWVAVFHAIYDPQHPDPLLRALLGLWLLAITAAYFVVSWVHVGATIGMRAWKCRLVQADGRRLGVRLAVARFVLASVSLGLAGCGFWYAWFDHERRAWHDRVCGTRVVRL